MNSLVVFVDGERHNFVFIPNQKCNHDSNEIILETLSIPEKALKTSVLLLGLHEVRR